MPHIPVLLNEVIEGLTVKPGGLYIDATVGAGGHAEAILEASSPNGCLLGIDADEEAVRLASEKLARFGDRVVIVRANFSDLAFVARREGFIEVDGILFDLGFASFQIENPERGFSLYADGPLDMRYDRSKGFSAYHLVNRLKEKELAEIIRRYGEEPKAHRIARAIVRARPIRTTLELARVVEQVTGPGRGRLHPATRTFLALRIAVNDELGALRAALPQAVELLAPGGRVAVISFHSLEDRIVKEFFRRESRDCICPPEVPVCCCGHKATLRVITPKPIRPSPEEVEANPRSRSARLRIAEKITQKGGG
ncbi:MAG: 16S rRNA (cytosine(1402)-N(4))-methyltransferase [Chloroflexi bacterium]|nr:MAG: 16S rRNA (cytosine(1402)-N(4))-methyltransferase [Chloroflexota bacterium]